MLILISLVVVGLGVVILLLFCDYIWVEGVCFVVLVDVGVYLEV